jgi:hypothetical protein
VSKVEEDPIPAPSQTPDKPKKKRHPWRILSILLLLFVAALVAARLALPDFLRWYVNRTIDQSQIYRGRIGDISVHLWRGAYTIHDIRLNKATGNVPVPLYSAKQVDLSLDWDALLHRRLKGKIVMIEPELNFVDGKTDEDSQTGVGGPWLAIIKDLFPFRINKAIVHNGAIHLRTYQPKEPVDVYLSELEAHVDNLTNIDDSTEPLIATVDAKAMAMGHAKFEYEMKLDPSAYHPTYHLTTRLLGLDVTSINNLALAYGQFNFKRGRFDLVVEVDAKEGQMTGYVKPLFRNLQVFSLVRDVKEDNPVQLFWQALVGLTTEVFKNQSRDQFGTLIPFTGTTENNNADIMAAVGNLLRNAFVRAYLPRLEAGSTEHHDLQFEAPEITEDVPIGVEQ